MVWNTKNGSLANSTVMSESQRGFVECLLHQVMVLTFARKESDSSFKFRVLCQEFQLLGASLGAIQRDVHEMIIIAPPGLPLDVLEIAVMCSLWGSIESIQVDSEIQFTDETLFLERNRS
jgi:hypothetical protein